MPDLINLLSDTLTLPTPAMRQAMFSAQVGDDVFREDPTVLALEAKVAALFGHEAALFCPSGTMTNQLAIKLHTQPLDEMICEQNSHVYQYEVGGYAFHSGIAVNLVEGTHGKMTAAQVAAAIKPIADWLPRTRLVVLENTCNKGGGSIYTLPEVAPIRDLCQERGLALHLDGARLFNALVETGETPLQWGALFDSISICLSKGLGAPVGSVLVGNAELMARARRLRKAMGGGMRQVGYLAAAGIYALDHHLDRLRQDNDHARLLGEALARQAYVAAVRPVQSNIVIFDLREDLTAAQVLDLLASRQIKASAFGPQTIRFVTHLDVSTDMIAQAITILDTLEL